MQLQMLLWNLTGGKALIPKSSHLSPQSMKEKTKGLVG